MTDVARRPWYRKKRFVATLAVTLAAAYPTGFLAVQYLDGRGAILAGGILDRALSLAYAPINLALFGPDGPRPAFLWFTLAGYDAHRIGALHRMEAEAAKD